MSEDEQTKDPKKSATPAQLEAMDHLKARKDKGREIAYRRLIGDKDVPYNPLVERHY